MFRAAIHPVKVVSGLGLYFLRWLHAALKLPTEPKINLAVLNGGSSDGVGIEPGVPSDRLVIQCKN